MLTRIHPERIAAASCVPAPGCDLTHLTNDELIAGTRRLVGSSNQLFAMLLAHLAEVEARGLHRQRACSSLYTYCIYELRFSEDAAFRRVSAARLVKRFPALYQAIANGELHLTGLLMLGPHLTPENHLEVLGRAKHRTKKELDKLLRTLDPLPDLPARIEPLRPAPARSATMNPSWADFVESLCPVVRELGPGDAPRDWVGDLRDFGSDAAESANDGLHAAEPSVPAPARPEPSVPAPARSETTAVTGPLRYGVQFSAGEEYVQLVERAKALLSHAHGKSSLEEIHLRAMRLLVADLEKRRFGKVAQREGAAQDAGPVREPNEPNEPDEPDEPDEPRAARPRGRHIPAVVRREVFERDAARCTFVDEAGQRCRETHGLELHHLRAFAQGGEHLPLNVTLRCRAHNALAAEEDFGRDFVEKKRARNHELFGSG